MTNSLCQVICFLCLPEPSNTQINSSTRNQITHAMVRTCAIGTATDKKRSSVLFHRWRKKYNGRTKIADVAIIPVMSILKPVPVINENPELILQQDQVPVYLHSGLEQELLDEDCHNLRSKKKKCSDVVWEVKEYKK